MESLKERIAKNTMPITETGCHIWEGAISDMGYGTMRVDGINRLVHRVVYSIYYGPILKGLNVCHKCDVRSCVNPKHLFLGTQSDNIRDCVAKGRHANTSKTHCKHGHEFTPENTRMYNGVRCCRKCKVLDNTKSRNKIRKFDRQAAKIRQAKRELTL